jgi:hypothetical protein
MCLGGTNKAYTDAQAVDDGSGSGVPISETPMPRGTIFPQQANRE